MGGYAEGEKGPGFPWLGCLGALATLVGLGLGVGSFASGHAVEAHQQEEAALFAQPVERGARGRHASQLHSFPVQKKGDIHV